MAVLQKPGEVNFWGPVAFWTAILPLSGQVDAVVHAVPSEVFHRRLCLIKESVKHAHVSSDIRNLFVW